MGWICGNQDELIEKDIWVYDVLFRLEIGHSKDNLKRNSDISDAIVNLVASGAQCEKIVERSILSAICISFRQKYERAFRKIIIILQVK